MMLRSVGRQSGKWHDFSIVLDKNKLVCRRTRGPSCCRMWKLLFVELIRMGAVVVAIVLSD